MTHTFIELPAYLKQYIAEQDYSLYTPIDHASWRYIMRVSKKFFGEHAHPKYIEGLKETGVTTDRIPLISEMDDKLKKFGWRAVIITGFIPPEPFLEMLAHRILPIAADMRKIENIDYTPAPDIVHEAAGHAPILADPDYSAYLKKFGEIARRVIFAKEDNELYEAVLNLSETKENPSATKADIEKAQLQLEEAVKNVGYVSEAQQVTRLGWWSTEYGLYKKEGKYLIYGAGLLSSVGESFNCLSDKVKKVPLTVDCIETTYDITKPQPQLFVTDDFKKLEKVIDELANKMAYRHGGVEGLAKAKKAQTVTTTVFESGVQVSGVVSDYWVDSKGDVCFLKLSGPCQISENEIQMEGHGADYHTEGFSSPLGSIKGMSAKPWLATAQDWKTIGCVKGQTCHFEFESGISIEGRWISSFEKDGKTLVMSFQDCTVRSGQAVLFNPEWGTFDMILGEKVVSVFGGAADRNAFAQKVHLKQFKARPQKCNLTNENKDLVNLYRIVREIRETNTLTEMQIEIASSIKKRLDESFPQEWLLRLELLELFAIHKLNRPLCDQLRSRLNELASESERMKMLITRGLALIEL
ncbi:MAG: hypothetical protein RJB66_2027 [Pseudomonadota bacterium]|jgi:phenylalanine-4-hydroxylase